MHIITLGNSLFSRRLRYSSRPMNHKNPSTDSTSISGNIPTLEQSVTIILLSCLPSSPEYLKTNV